MKSPSKTALEFRARMARRIAETDLASRHPRDLTGPWLSTESVRQRFDFPSRQAVRAWAAREVIVPIRRGRSLRYAVADIEAAIRRGS